MKLKLAKLWLTLLALSISMPAFASDFSGLIYFFVGVYLLVFSVIAIPFWFATRAITIERNRNIIRALVITITFAPCLGWDGYMYMPFGLMFIIFSIFFGAENSDSAFQMEVFLNTLPVLLIIFAALYFFLRHRMMRKQSLSANSPDDVDAS